MSDICIGLCTCPDKQTARQIAEHLLQNHAAACINIIEGITSVYRWQGEVMCDAEVQLVIKTSKDKVSHAWQLVRQLHPYDTPEWLVLDVTDGSQEYLDWVRTSIQ